jgi:hypothetical protein
VVDLTGGDRQNKIGEGLWLGTAVTKDLPKSSLFDKGYSLFQIVAKRLFVGDQN